jgi:DNA processing protein
MAHRRLASSILDKGGALLGEMPPGSFPVKYAFPRRNRILSGLCRGCIVVQAPEKSGALITADFALDQNRDLYVASSGMEGAASAGTRNLESQGAPVISGASDVMGDWGRFLDIRTVDTVAGPGGADDLVKMMKLELDGRLYRHMGGWFEYRGA